MCAACDHERQMLGRTSLPLLGAWLLAVVALAGCEGHPQYTFVNDKKPGDTNGEGSNAFGGSWFAVSPAADKVASRSQPQGRSGYGSGY